MIKLVFVLLFVSSFQAQANNIFNTNEQFSKYGSVVDKKDKEFAENIMFLINEIDKKDYLNFEKKEILKQKVMFIYKSILVADSEEVFVNYLVPDFFNLSLCIPYFVREDSDSEVHEILNNFANIEGEVEIERYEKIHNIVYSSDISEIGVEYVAENTDKIEEICYSRNSFSTIEEIVTALSEE